MGFCLSHSNVFFYILNVRKRFFRIYILAFWMMLASSISMSLAITLWRGIDTKTILDIIHHTLYINLFKSQILETMTALNIFNHLLIKMNERINSTNPVLFEWKVNDDCSLLQYYEVCIGWTRTWIYYLDPDSSWFQFSQVTTSSIAA